MATSSLNDKIKSVDLQRLAQDFQGLDPNDPGVWPLAPRIAAFIATFVAVVAAAWWFDWKPLGEQLEAAQATEFELKQKWTAKKRQAVNLDVYREQLAEIDREFITVISAGNAHVDAVKRIITNAVIHNFQ